ncbi:MAG: DNA-processing protein DprA [Oscillospiraceae bacterium]
MVESHYWIWMQQLFGIGTARSDEILSRFDSPKEIYDMNREELVASSCFTSGEIEKIMSTTLEKAKAAVEKARKLGAKILTPDCENYPIRLRNIYSPPLTLYILGELPDVDTNLSIAMVGTRKCTKYGEVTAKKISEELAEAGVIIISGLAVGIDAISHQAAIDKGKKTIAVIGSGIDNDYPIANLSIRRKIIEGNGAIITEFMPGIMPNPFNFPMRNRIISGLSSGIVVVEAAKKSGTLITAGHALSQDRDVFAVPGSIYKEMCEGSNMLIKQGAKLVTCGADVLDEYSLYYNYILKPLDKTLVQEEETPEQMTLIKSETQKITKKKVAPPPYLNQEQLLVFNTISDGEKTSEEISEILDVPINVVLSILTELEIFGAIKTISGRKFTV